MAKALKLLLPTSASPMAALNAGFLSKFQLSGVNHALPKFFGNSTVQASRAQCTLSAARGQLLKQTQSFHSSVKKISAAKYSTEVDKEISNFLEKEIQYEKSRASDSLPKVCSGFEVTTDGADVTFTKQSGSEKIIVRLSINGAVGSMVPEGNESQEEPPQMICRPPFEVEISKDGGAMLALQCSFPPDDVIEEAGQQESEQIDDQFEIQEVSIHDGEWKDSTYSVSAATMDAELFDLLMDMLDERGINDEFIAHLVDYCTAYENQKYIKFLGSLKSFAEK